MLRAERALRVAQGAVETRRSSLSQLIADMERRAAAGDAQLEAALRAKVEEAQRFASALPGWRSEIKEGLCLCVCVCVCVCVLTGRRSREASVGDCCDRGSEQGAFRAGLRHSHPARSTRAHKCAKCVRGHSRGVRPPKGKCHSSWSLLYRRHCGCDAAVIWLCVVCAVSHSVGRARACSYVMKQSDALIPFPAGG
jgi:hypothetical protein